MHICHMNDLMQIWETNGSHSRISLPSGELFSENIYGAWIGCDGGIRETDGSRSEFSLHPGPNREHFHLVMVA